MCRLRTRTPYGRLNGRKKMEKQSESMRQVRKQCLLLLAIMVCLIASLSTVTTLAQECPHLYANTTVRCHATDADIQQAWQKKDAFPVLVARATKAPLDWTTWFMVLLLGIFLHLLVIGRSMFCLITGRETEFPSWWTRLVRIILGASLPVVPRLNAKLCAICGLFSSLVFIGSYYCVRGDAELESYHKILQPYENCCMNCMASMEVLVYYAYMLMVFTGAIYSILAFRYRRIPFGLWLLLLTIIIIPTISNWIIDTGTRNSDWKAGSAFAQGDELLKKNDFNVAVTRFNDAINLDPKYAEAYCKRGIAYGNLRQFQKTIDDCSKAIEIYPKYAGAYEERGVAYDNLGQYNKAIEDCSKAIELDPSCATTYVSRAFVYGHLGQYQKAIEDCNKAIQLNPGCATTYAEAYAIRAGAYGKRGITRKRLTS